MISQHSLSKYSIWAACACWATVGCGGDNGKTGESEQADAGMESSTEASLPPPDAPETPTPTRERVWGVETASNCRASGMVVGTDKVFVQTSCSPYEYSIVAVPKDGSAASVMAKHPNRFGALRYHGGEVFYETDCVDESKFYRCLMARSETTLQEREVTQVKITFTSELQISDDLIVAVHQSNLDGTHEIVSVPRSGGTFEPVTTEPDMLSAVGMQGSTVFWVSGNCYSAGRQLKSMLASGGVPAVLVDLGPSCIGTLCGSAFCASEGGELVARYFDGSVSVLAASKAFHLDFDGTFLYWAEFDASEAWRVDLAGGQPVLVYDSSAEVVDLAASSSADVYVLTAFDLYRVQPAQP
jgi:hypothetical protein